MIGRAPVAGAPRWRHFPLLAHAGWPNLVTSLAALCAVASFVPLLSGAVRLAITLAFAALVLDHFDGPLARRLGKVSEFGRELDGLMEAVAFCALPAVAAYAWVGRSPFLDAALAVFVAMGFWRLAALHADSEGHGHTLPGMPTPTAAAWFFTASPVLYRLPASVRGEALPWLFLVLAVLMASGLAIPKGGRATVVLYVLAPLAIASLWLA